MSERHDRLFSLYNALLRNSGSRSCMANKDVSESQLEQWITECLPRAKEWAENLLVVARELYDERMEIIEQAERELSLF